MRAIELALIVALGVAIAAFHVRPDSYEPARYAVAAGITGALAIALFDLLGLYAIPAMQRMARVLPRLIAAWTLAVAVLVTAVFFLQLGLEFSRFWLATWYAAVTGTLVVGRLAARRQGSPLGARRAASTAAP